VALHRLTHIVMGVPNVAETAAYYTEFGLRPSGDGQATPDERTFATVDGGEQLTIVRSRQRQLVRLGIGVDDPDDLDRVSAALAALGVPAGRNEISVRADDPGTGVADDPGTGVPVRVEIAARVAQQPTPAPACNEVGRGASAMLEADPSRHTWGLGRHFIGSSFFWYLKDPAGNFSKYYSDLDCIGDDARWQPGVWEGARSLWAWGPPPPSSFLAPDDLRALMAGAHQAP